MENKTVSLQQIYDQVQEMLNKAGIPTAGLHVEGKIQSYQHIKEGKYSGKPNMVPETTLRVSILQEGRPIIATEHWSPEVVLTTIRMELEKVKLIANTQQMVGDITME